jgi:ATP-dependent Lon protease
MERTGIKADQFTIEDRVIEMLVEEYSLGEPGVRYL